MHSKQMFNMDLHNNVGVDESTRMRVQRHPPTLPPPSLSLLHSVRKRLAKPWKKPMQPLPPPPKVYRVDSINFRKVVQQLTGAPEIRSERLHSTAPPPPVLFTPPSLSDHTYISRTQQKLCINVEPEGSSSSSSLSSAPGSFYMSEASLITAPGSLYMSDASLGPFDFSDTSPASYVSWPPSFPVLSPGTRASFEQSSTILY